MEGMSRMAAVIAAAAVLFCIASTAYAQWAIGVPVNMGPVVNSAQGEGSPDISSDGLELYFHSTRPGGFGGVDLWVAIRPTRESPWGSPRNLGPKVNTAGNEIAPSVSPDGLTLYFCDYMAPRPGGFGGSDLWVATRTTRHDEWGTPVNLGPLVNSSSNEITPEVSTDGLELYFESDRPGQLGGDDLFVARRATRKDPWSRVVWLGPIINTVGMDHCPTLSTDGLTMFFDCTPPGATVGDLMVTMRESLDSDWGKPVNLGHAASDHWASGLCAGGDMLYFCGQRPGGSGSDDLWQVPVLYNAER